MIIFKNVYPKDFVDLQAEKGIIKDTFLNIGQKKKEVTNQEQEELASIEKLLIDVDKEILDSCKEIKIAMLSAITDWEGIASRITINYNTFHPSDSYTIQQILDDSFDLSLLKSIKTINVEYNIWGRHSNNRIIDNVVLSEYIKRWENYKRTVNDNKRSLQKKIEIIKNKIQKINSYSLKSMIEEYGVILPLLQCKSLSE